MGGSNTVNPGVKPPPTVTTQPQASQTQPQTKASSQPPSAPPGLSSIYANPKVGSGGDQAQAANLGKTIQNFYADSFTKTFQAVQSDHNNGRDATQNETALAADIATLHGLEAQFSKATTGSVDQAFSDPSHTTEGSTNTLLGAAGSKHTQDDFSYQKTGSDNDSTQHVQVDFTGPDKGVSGQAGNGFTTTSQGTQINTGVGGSSNPQANVGWTTTNSDTSIRGGVYNQAQGQDAFNKLTSSSDFATTLSSLSPQQRADAYTYQTTLTGADKAATIQNPAAKILAGYQTNANPAQVATNTDSYNAVLSFFTKQAGSS